MIIKNEMEQYLGCTLCGEMVELSRRTLQNPETVLIMIETLHVDHADCAQYAHDPRLAAIQRGYKVRMRRELERAAGPVRGGRSAV